MEKPPLRIQFGKSTKRFELTQSSSSRLLRCFFSQVESLFTVIGPLVADQADVAGETDEEDFTTEQNLVAALVELMRSGERDMDFQVSWLAFWYILFLQDLA